MPTNKLKDAQCRGAKALEQPCKLFDGGGLHLFVSPTGAKIWRAAHRLMGKPKTISFGPYPDVSLAEAREKLSGVKAILRQGGDPMAKKPGKRGMTFRDAVGAYWEGRNDVTDGYRTDALRGLEMYLFPALDLQHQAQALHGRFIHALDFLRRGPGVERGVERDLIGNWLEGIAGIDPHRPGAQNLLDHGVVGDDARPVTQCARRRNVALDLQYRDGHIKLQFTAQAGRT
jgi:hypothetical protein